MPENKPQSSNSGKKARLGRGLGSLLGGGALETASDVVSSAPTAAPAAAPTSATATASPVAPAPAPEKTVTPKQSNQAQPAQVIQPSSTVATQKVETAPNQAAPVTNQKSGSAVAEALSSPAQATKPIATQPVPTQTHAQAEQKPAVAPVASAAPTPVQAEIKKTAPASTVTQVPVSQAVSSNTVPTEAPVRAVSDESQIWMIAIDKLKPNNQQPRQVFTPEALRDLTASVKEKGILQPIVARRLNEREFQIIAGERRWRAAQAAGLHQVPVILKKVSEQDSLELAIIENIQRENLNPLEEAEAYDRLLIDYSLTQQQVADKLGKERSTIANSLRLLTLPLEIKEFLKKNELSAGHAKVLLGLEDSKAQISIARQIVADKLSVRATEKLVARAKIEARGGNQQTNKTDMNVSKRLIEGLSAELQKLIGTKVSIDYADSKGKLSVHFYSDDQLNHVVEKLRKAWEK